MTYVLAKPAPLASVPTLNDWARTAGRPTVPTPTGKRSASRRLRKVWKRAQERAEQHRFWSASAAYTMSAYERIMAAGARGGELDDDFSLP